MSEPLVSVVIPMYNHACYVRECLDSLLREGWPNLEVLVIDDGSTDDSFETAQRWRREHPAAFSRFELGRQENQGVTRTLNRLVAQSKGEYLTLVASDDALLPGGLAKRVGVLEEHPEWLAVFADSIVVDENGQKILSSGLTQLYRYSARPRVLLNNRLIHLELILRWTVPGPGLLTRREAYDPLQGVGLYDEGMAVEDRDFYLRLLGKEALGFVNATVAAYRVHGGNSIKALGDQKTRHFEAYARSAYKAYLNAKGIERIALRADFWRYRALISNTPFPQKNLVAIFFKLLIHALRFVQDLRCVYTR